MSSAEEPSQIRIGDALHALATKPAQHGQAVLPNLPDSLYDELWKRIVNLEFAPGSRLSDELLAKELGVSRTPMREALYRLSQVGLVRVSPRRGFFMPTVTRDDAIEVYDFRTALETFATRIATPLLTEVDLTSRIEGHQRDREHATSRSPVDIEEFVHSDLLLHDLLLQRAGNRRMRRILADLTGQLSIIHLRIARAPQWRTAAIEEHGRILEALAARDADRAAKAMEAHLRGVKERVLDDFA